VRREEGGVRSEEGRVSRESEVGEGRGRGRSEEGGVRRESQE